MDEIRNECKILVGKPEGRYTWETRRRYENNTKMDLKDIGCDIIDSITLGKLGVDVRITLKWILKI
jgi:hypothetical protein